MRFPLGGRGKRKEAKLVLLCGQRTSPGATEEGDFGFLGSPFLTLLQPVTLARVSGSRSPSDPGLSHFSLWAFAPRLKCPSS